MARRPRLVPDLTGGCMAPARPPNDRMTKPIADGPEGDYAPLVSVIIPCIDDTFVVATLKSLATQQAAPAFEVLVVDGGHSDLGRQLEGWRERLQLQVVKAPGGHTAGDQRNRGAAASRGFLPPVRRCGRYCRGGVPTRDGECA